MCTIAREIMQIWFQIIKDRFSKKGEAAKTFLNVYFLKYIIDFMMQVKFKVIPEKDKFILII